jgi:peptide/nickel transport system substrate-binding protein
MTRNGVLSLLIILAGISISGCGDAGNRSQGPDLTQPETKPVQTGVTAGNQKTTAGVQIPEGAEVIRDVTPGKKGGELVLGMPGDPKTFNVPLISDATSQQISGYLYEGLIGFDNITQKHGPAIATSWKYDEASSEWVFNIRKNMKWSDGEDLTSDDLMFYIEIINDPKVPNDEVTAFKADGTPYGFRAPDPHTFIVKIPAVDSFAFLNLGLIRALPRHKYGDALKDGTFAEILGTAYPPGDIITSGPYRIRKFKSGEHIILEPNPHYYKFDTNGTQLPYLDQVIFLNVETAEAITIRFLAGDLDMNDRIQAENLAQVREEAGAGNYTVYNTGPSLSINHYWFNLHPGGSYDGEGGERKKWIPQKPGDTPPADILQKNFNYFIDPVKRKWFEEVDFRKACSMATNRPAIVKTVMFGEAVPLYGIIPPSNKLWFNPDVPKYPYNPAKAKVLLDKLGFMDRDGDGFREDQDGHAIRFTLVSNKETDNREKMCTLIKEDMRKIGLDVSSQMLDFNDLIGRLVNTMDYDACLLGMASGIPPHPSMSSNTILSTGRMHHHFPQQPSPMTTWEAKVDELYAGMKRTFDEEKQKKSYFEIQRIYGAEQPVIHLISPNLHVAAKNNIGNLKPTPLRPHLTHNLEELYIK